MMRLSNGLAYLLPITVAAAWWSATLPTISSSPLTMSIASRIASASNRRLVVFCTEFGRTPWAQDGKGTKGRAHHPHAFSCWLAGGGVKRGVVYGQSDEIGDRVQEGAVHIHDLHDTILHVMGLDHERLTFRRAGRDFRLTDVYGRVVRDILT